MLYFKIIKHIQSIVSVWAVVIFLFAIPFILAFAPELLPKTTLTTLFSISLWSVTFVMMIRPLADIFGSKHLRALVILRKSFGILSASIIVGLILVKVIQHGGTYFAQILTPEYWSLTKYKLLAHLGDITAVILLITSNSFSKHILGIWWKRIQRLSYVYFYAGALYELFAFNSFTALMALLFVTLVTFLAFIKNRFFNPKDIFI